MKRYYDDRESVTSGERTSALIPQTPIVIEIQRIPEFDTDPEIPIGYKEIVAPNMWFNRTEKRIKVRSPSGNVYFLKSGPKDVVTGEPYYYSSGGGGEIPTEWSSNLMYPNERYGTTVYDGDSPPNKWDFLHLNDGKISELVLITDPGDGFIFYFKEAQHIQKARFYDLYDDLTTETFKLQGYDVSWEDLVTAIPCQLGWQEVTFATAKSYREYRLLCESDERQFGCTEWEMYKGAVTGVTWSYENFTSEKSETDCQPIAHLLPGSACGNAYDANTVTATQFKLKVNTYGDAPWWTAQFATPIRVDKIRVYKFHVDYAPDTCYMEIMKDKGTIYGISSAVLVRDIPSSVDWEESVFVDDSPFICPIYGLACRVRSQGYIATKNQTASLYEAEFYRATPGYTYGSNICISANGAISGSGECSNTANIIDENGTTYGRTNVDGAEQYGWIQFTFSVAKQIQKVKAYKLNHEWSPGSGFEIRAYDSESGLWELLVMRIPEFNGWGEYEFENNKSYTQYRIHSKSGYDTLICYSLEMYERT